MSESPTFLVTGGAGFLGHQPDPLPARARPRGRSLDLAASTTRSRTASRDRTATSATPTTSRAAMEGVDIVVHCAAALPLYTPEDIHTTDVDGTRTVLEARRRARRRALRPHLVDGGLRHSGPPPAARGRPARRRGPVRQGQGRRPRTCASSTAAGDVRARSSGPSPSSGPSGWACSRCSTTGPDGHGFPMIGSGSNRYQLLDVEDLCDAIYLCCTLDRGIASTTPSTSARRSSRTMREDYQAVLDDAGFGKKIVGFPAAPDDLDAARARGAAAVAALQVGLRDGVARTRSSRSKRPSACSATRRSTRTRTR